MRALDPATWSIVSPLLDRALDLDAPDRARLLAEVQHAHPAAATVLEALLSSHERLLHSDFLQSSTIDGPLTSLAGSQIGAYTLTSLLGAGGMGAVWKAHRSDGRFEGDVAIKLLHLSVLTSSGQARFTREGTLLARLSHPNIARLLDAGLTPSGQPYLVLEHVDGVHVDRYADKSRLNVHARVQLMRQVAEAVAHAHTHLIVHRDLKPSNILVDAQGKVKLLDFGVATLVGGDLPAADRTITGGRPMTPEYAAPEQIRGELVTTASDVYALGVILYRLLVRAHPTSEDGANSLDHARAIVERDPRPPSGVVAALGEERERVAAARSTTPERLSRSLVGDLDTVVLKALAKDPTRRYAGATAFADDLGRVLRHEPVAARPDRWTYRASKFVRRHRGAVAAAAGVVVALAAATAVTTDRMIEAQRQRDQAEFQARRAQASSEFMRYLVTQIGTTPMTMRQVLDRGRVALEQQYNGDPAFVARMLMQLSGPYIELGDYKTSADMMSRALEIATTLDDPELLAAVHCGKAVDLVEEQDAAGAKRHLAEAAALAARVAVARPNTECATGETRLALLERRYDDAVVHAEKAVRLLDAAGNTTTTRYTSAQDNLAQAYGGAGRLLEELATQQRVTDVSRQIGRGETIGVVVSLQNEAGALRSLGRWLDADRRFREAAQLASRIDRSGRVPGYLLINHAWLLVSLRRDDEAVALLAQAHAGGGIPSMFKALGELTDGLLRIARDDVEGARRVYDGLAPPQRTALPAKQMHVVSLLGARIARMEGRVEDARAIVGRAIAESGFPARSAASQPELLAYAAELSLELGAIEQAIQQARDAVRVADARFGQDAPSALAGRAHLMLGAAMAASGNAREVRAELAHAATMLEQTAGAEHPWTLDAHQRLVRLPN